MSNIIEQDYTKKEYQYKASNGTLYDVDYTIRFNHSGDIQAIAKYSYYPTEEPENRELNESVGKDDGYLRFAGYDFPRCECEIRIRNIIAEEIEKMIDGKISYNDAGLTNGDLGLSDLSDDRYFEQSYDDMMSYDEDDYDEDDYDEYGIEECGIEACDSILADYLPNEMEPTVLGIDKNGYLAVATGLHKSYDSNKINGIDVYFVEPINKQRIEESVYDYIDDDEDYQDSNFKHLANRYGYDIVNADENELREIREDIFDRVMSNIGEFEDIVYGVSGIQTNYDIDNKVERSLDNLAQDDQNGYEMIRNYYLKNDNIDIDADDVWCWNIGDTKKTLDLYNDSGFKIVVNRKLMNNIKAFSKSTDQTKMMEEEAIKDFERNGLSNRDRVSMFRN